MPCAGETECQRCVHARLSIRRSSEVVCGRLCTGVSLSRTHTSTRTRTRTRTRWLTSSCLPTPPARPRTLVWQISKEDVVMAVFSQAFKIDRRIVAVWVHVLLQVQRAELPTAYPHNRPLTHAPTQSFTHTRTHTRTHTLVRARAHTACAVSVPVPAQCRCQQQSFGFCGTTKRASTPFEQLSVVSPPPPPFPLPQTISTSALSSQVFLLSLSISPPPPLPPSLPPSLSLSLSHTHTRTRTHIWMCA